MTDKEKLDAIRAEIHRLVDVRGYDREMANDLFAFMNSLPNEPVSEELQKAAEQDVCEVVNSCSATRIPNDHIPSWVQDAMVNEFIHGAQWQKEQFETNRLAACDRQTDEEAEREQDFVMGIIECEHRQPTFDDAIKYGMRLQKEQMMAKAVDGEEIWKPVVGFTGYEVSSKGRVLSRKSRKDLELTVDDIKTIDRLLNQCVDFSNPYKEVLKRYNIERKEK